VSTLVLIGLLIAIAVMIFVPRCARARGASDRTAKRLRALLMGAPLAATLGILLLGLPGGVIFYIVLGPYFVLKGMLGANPVAVPNDAMWPVAIYISLLWPWAIPLGYTLARWRFAQRPLLVRLTVVAGVEYVWLFGICYSTYRAALY